MMEAVPPATPLSNSARRRARENETPSQRVKREKAAERQRRKRERDRAIGLGLVQSQPSQQPAAPEFVTHEMTADEIARRDRVRAAARERQRKHRQLVKQRKMRELGLDMGNELLQGMDDVQYRVEEEQYQQVLGELSQQQPALAPHEPPFPNGQQHGGQTFATTLLLSFSCAPLLKQHLLRTLNMSNEELASFEPIIADAWDQWNHQRQLHYEQQAAAAANGGPPPPPPFTVDIEHSTAVYQQPPPPPPQDPTNEFRARFHRSLIAPSPFQTSSQPPSTPASGSVADQIDPHLAAPGTKGSPSRSESVAQSVRAVQ
ncbi:hypothetical protein EDD18DRAFT_1311743 [Armillaria luteobubalina]|uniref:Uncharacterized protein n=1 Tax=Armillaria luteobubalina TaxID=153913 RepID=A0AA39UDK5_9AGAR|nr:hypothetical protein EDD18DRAFT_1311743 [Armillaria luteobubalina]